MPVHHHRSILDHPLEEVFAWHARSGAFQRLTPPWESVRVLERTGEMWDGGHVVLGLRKGPAELKWEVKHTAFQENVLFRDEQVSGPFGRWVHTHRFSDAGSGRTLMEDEVEWEAPLGALGQAFGGSFIAGELERLFAFRHRRLAHDLELLRRYPLKGGATVVVSGASGLIGASLVSLLRTGGYRVRPLERRRGSGGDPDGIAWDIQAGTLDREELEGVDAVVHLAGESIAGGRWTDEKKRRILESREKGTHLLAGALAGLRRKPGVLVSASASGYYGDRRNEIVTEDAPAGDGFLSRVCVAWEGATEAARRAGIRTVLLRSGVVLSPAGGALGQMLLPFKVGVGGRIGRGNQYMPWIDLDDEVGLILHAMATSGLAGPLNGTAPEPVTNAAFTDILGRVLRRPTLLPLPALALKALFGEMGEALLLEGVRMVPRKALESGYRFLLPSLEDSLRFQLGAEEEAGAGRAEEPGEQG